MWRISSLLEEGGKMAFLLASLSLYMNIHTDICWLEEIL